MPNPTRVLPANLFTLLSTAANAFVTLVTFYILKYIFELPFHCFCAHGIHTYDIMFLCAPPVIIFLLVFIIDKHQHRLFCGYHILEDQAWNWLSCVVEHILRLLLVGLFWFAAVFLDGDWYECYKATNGTVCKNQTLSYEKIQLNPHHRNESLVIGLSLTMSGVVVWASWSCYRINFKCCEPYNLLRDRLKNIQEQGTAQGNAQGTAQANAQANAQGTAQGNAQENAQANAQGNAQGTAQGNAQENAQANAQGNAQENAQANAQGNAQGTAQENAQGNAQGTAQGNAQENAQGNAKRCWACLSKCFSTLCKDQSDIIESRDVSLLSRHLQKEIEADVERQIQELAKERAAVIIKTRVRELRRALQINDQPRSQSDEGATSTRGSRLSDEPGQEGNASVTGQLEDQPGPSFSPGVNVKPQHKSESEAGERDVLLNNPDQGATSAQSSRFTNQLGQEGKASTTDLFEMEE